MITCPHCAHAWVPVQPYVCSMPWCGRSDPHPPGYTATPECRPRLLSDVVPPDWDGTYRIALGGKSGELLFFSGILPAIRKAIPKAKVVISIHPHFAGIVPGLEHQPDEVRCEDWYTKPWPLAPLATQVQHGLKADIASWGGHNPRTLTLLDDHTLVTGAYLRHRASKPFYRLFMDSCGVGDGEYVAPRWRMPPEIVMPLGRVVSRIALVLPSANIHAGNGVRKMELATTEWLELARDADAAGLDPVATGHKDDPTPEMSGWYWADLRRPDLIFALLTQAARVVGFNSGMTFAATRLVPPGGRVTMIDSQMLDQYDFRRMAGVVGPEHVQIPLTEVKTRGYFDIIKEALR
jgi:hypothetical protein